ncbi:lecithin retinol acyltransferase family protein [Oleiphilus messinensis]
MMKKDLKTCFSPGDIIRVRYSTFTHYGVVSDRTGEDGMPMIIDNSYASGTAVERTWAEATVGKVPSLSKIGSEYPAQEILACAKQLIGQSTRYSLTRYNCEHFVREVVGLKPASRQVRYTSIMVPAAMLLTHKIGKGKHWATAISGLLSFAITTRASAK